MLLVRVQPGVPFLCVGCIACNTPIRCTLVLLQNGTTPPLASMESLVRLAKRLAGGLELLRGLGVELEHVVVAREDHSHADGLG